MADLLPLGNFARDGRRFAGLVSGESVIELDAASTAELLDDWDATVMRLAAGSDGPEHELGGLQILPPVQPRQILQAGANYRKHVLEILVAQGQYSREQAAEIVDARASSGRPYLFVGLPSSLCGPYDDVVLPPEGTEHDWELELAVVIGRAGAHFDAAEAASYIAGYTIFNDITARDIQRREMRSGVFSFCKAIDTFCPLGPWIVTPDEVGDPHDLRMQLRVNGELRQQSHSGNMSVTIPEIISHYSALGYSPGDVLSTGTVSGVAGFSENAASLYLRPGDRIECEIEKIGTLANPVISWQEGHGVPAPPRQRW